MSPLATSSKLNPSTLESLINHQCKQFIWTTIMLVHHNISPLWHRNTSVILILFFLLLPYFHCLLLSILSLTLHWYFKYLSSLILTIFFWKNCTSQYTSSHHKQFSSPEELLDQLVPSWPSSTRPRPLLSFFSFAEISLFPRRLRLRGNTDFRCGNQDFYPAAPNFVCDGRMETSGASHMLRNAGKNIARINTKVSPTPLVPVCRKQDTCSTARAATANPNWTESKNL